jgi:HK97 family phage prohead protease
MEERDMNEDQPIEFDAPRDNLLREARFEVDRSANDGLTLVGYASVFNQITRIDNHEGRFDEQIMRGAFTKTLSERTPKLMFNHGQFPLIGDFPIGVINRAKEDSRGLHITARLSDNWLVAPVRDAIRDGAITGMSFHMRILNQSVTRGIDVPIRSVTEVRCRELGPVTEPAYAGTSVSVRSQSQLLLDNIAPELRDDLQQLIYDTAIRAGAEEATTRQAAVLLASEPALSHSEATQGADPRAWQLISEALRLHSR